jgi:hypothetical protein
MPVRIGKSHFCLDESDFVKLCVKALTEISASKPQFPFVKRATFQVRDAQDPKWSTLYYLIVSAQAPEPVEEIVAAGADSKVRVLACEVMTPRHGPCTLPVMFVADRPVGRIVPGPIELSLWLDIGDVTLVRQATAIADDRDGAPHHDKAGSPYHA